MPAVEDFSESAGTNKHPSLDDEFLNRIRPEEIRLGAWVSFVPTNYEYEPDPERPTHKLVVRQKGRIVQINAAHRWFQVEAEIGGRLYRECFKF